MSNFTLITELEHLEVRSYFGESKHYTGFDLPPYFSFDELLLSSSRMLSNRSLADICAKGARNKPDYPCNHANVNYIVLSNKDGGFAWRQLQLIHPVLYIDLVNLITEEDAWSEIREFFKRRDESSVECISLPLRSNIEESNKAVLVTNWWDKIEQESLRKALDFRFMFQTDISNCYPSIYTHSLEWAMCSGGRREIKHRRSEGEVTRNIGSEIDQKLQNMNQGQTIGIPQGSALMDFIAEIVLGGTDLELTDEIKTVIGKDHKFKILRYRDDYRVFTNDYNVGHEIMKILNKVLYNWDMRINAAKTSETNDIITASIKNEKLEEIYTAPIKHTFQKAAMRIYILSKKHPNAGLVAKHLTDYYDRLQENKEAKFDFEVVLAIVTMIAYRSPRYMSQVASIISTIINMSGKELDRKTVISKIVEKFENVPNTEFIDVWLQRITDLDNIHSYNFVSVITKVALAKEENSVLWNSEWLNQNDREIINTLRISTLPEKIENRTFSPLVEREEFALYRRDYD